MRPLSPNARRLSVELLEDRSNPSTAYIATDLISDQPGVAPVTDPTLVNAWGIALNPNGAIWISANGTGLSEVYTGDVNGSPIGQPFKVVTPGGSPTGQVFNGTTDFKVTDGTNTRPAAFIFASESGMVTGWNPAVGVAGSPPSKTAEVGFAATDGAIYKGIALANNGSGNFLYLADFQNGKIDVLDGQYHLTHLAGSFTDPNLPAGFAPFNVAAIDGKLYVSYAKQDPATGDDVAGKGNGFVSVFDLNGNFLQRLASGGDLNSPWGMVKAPTDFGDFGGDLLVGNFGDGRIHAYDPTSGQELGTLGASNGHPIVIDGLWGLAFRASTNPGGANSLYYAAGPEDETHGVFGRITANPEGTNPVSVKLIGTDLTITGSRGDDHVTVELTHGGRQLVVRANGDEIGVFDPAAVSTIHFRGFAGDDVFVVSPKVKATTFADGGAGDDEIVIGTEPPLRG